MVSNVFHPEDYSSVSLVRYHGTYTIVNAKDGDYVVFHQDDGTYVTYKLGDMRFRTDDLRTSLIVLNGWQSSMEV